MTDFLEGLFAHGVFSRGLPTRGDLSTTDYAKSLLQVLNEPQRFMVVTEVQDRDTSDPLRQCLERGWLFSEPHGEEQIKYRFASSLHQRYVEWLLLEKEAPITAPNLRTFVLEVLTCLNPKNLKTRDDLKSSGSIPQPIPEAQFQQEFYRACSNYTKSTLITFPKCGTSKGRIDFFIRSMKWGIELCVMEIGLLPTMINGEYGEWIREEKMNDYILIDFRSKVPTETLGK
jgi:hypothetical protein